MKTKRVTYWVDLQPGWQDQVNYVPYVNTEVPKWPVGCFDKRVRIAVELPCFGGSCEPMQDVEATVDSVKDGPQVL